jgi:hypothetical protein
MAGFNAYLGGKDLAQKFISSVGWGFGKGIDELSKIQLLRRQEILSRPPTA